MNEETMAIIGILLIFILGGLGLVIYDAILSSRLIKNLKTEITRRRKDKLDFGHDVWYNVFQEKKSFGPVEVIHITSDDFCELTRDRRLKDYPLVFTGIRIKGRYLGFLDGRYRKRR